MLGIPEGSNTTIEVGIFCMKNKIDEEAECEKVVICNVCQHSHRCRCHDTLLQNL